MQVAFLLSIDTMGYNVSIIGSGNVAWHLALHLEEAGNYIEYIWSRNPANAQKIVSKLFQGEVAKTLDFSEVKSQIFIIAVPDDAIEEIANQIIVPENAIVCHTSGSKSIRILESIDAQKGVFYPLQTFSKHKKVDWKNIPICIEATDEFSDFTLTNLAKSLSDYVYFLDSTQRKKLHLAAVFACNFTNHLYSIAEQLLENADIPFEILHPLIIETATKATNNKPSTVQTGPASRKDITTISNQIEALELVPQWQKIYKLITKEIMNDQQ